jgi:hypothetical protein
MMVTSSGVTIPKHHKPDQPPPPIQKMEILCKYFDLEIKAGRMKMDSPQIQSQAFLGALSHYAWCETLFEFRPAAPDDYVRHVVDIIVKGTKPGKPGRKK